LELENRKQKSKAMEIYKCITQTIITHSSHTFLETKSEIVDDDKRRRSHGVWLRKENRSRLSTWSSSQGGSEFHVIIATTRARTTTKSTATVGTIVNYIQRRAMIRTEKLRCIVETFWYDA
jgi:hypothetical protein